MRTPGEVEFEGNRTIVLHAKDRRTEYYAYAERDVVSAQNSPAEPVKQAYDNFGQVVDDQISMCITEETCRQEPDDGINRCGGRKRLQQPFLCQEMRKIKTSLWRRNMEL